MGYGRDVQMAVGGKGATAAPGAVAVPNDKTFDAIVAKSKDYAERLDRQEGILYECPTAKDLTLIVFESEAVWDPISKLKVAGRKSVRIRFDNGFYFLSDKDPNYARILTFIEGDGKENAPHPMFGNRFWRVEEAARRLHEEAVTSAVHLVVNSKDPALAKSLIARLQESIDVQIVDDESDKGGKDKKNKKSA